MNQGGKMIGRAAVTKSVVFKPEELADLQVAVIRMLWAWQAHREIKHPDAEENIDRFQQLYIKISEARWSEDKKHTRVG